jgi:hypothetical protein
VGISYLRRSIVEYPIKRRKLYNGHGADYGRPQRARA